METLKGQKAIVTGGTRGIGRGIVEALVAQQADVTVIARNQSQLDELAKRLGINVICGDVTDEALARKVLTDIQPNILILNAGATPVMSPLHELSWEDFNKAWDVDVKAGFYWVQAALRLPLPQGSRVIIGSSGAALNGSPQSGSYAGAKRMLWLMADYANGVAKGLNLEMHFQAIAPLQIIAGTDLGQQAASAYARKKGVSIEEYFAGFGAPMPPRKIGDHVVSILTDPRYEERTAFGLKGDLGIVSLDK